LETTALWQLLAGLHAWDVTEIPRIVAAPGEKGDGPAVTVAGERLKRQLSLASAFAAGGPFAFGWAQDRADGPVRVIAAGEGIPGEVPGSTPGGDPGDGPGAAPAGAGGVRLGFPAGAQGVPLRRGGSARVFAQMPSWLRLGVVPDALLEAELSPAAGPGSGPSLEEGLLRVWSGPFAFLVLAVPVDGDRHRELLMSTSEMVMRTESNGSDRAKLSARRWRARHEELRAALTTGLWDIYVFAGGMSPGAAARVAGLLCASLDLRGLPFALRRLDDRAASLQELLGAPPQIEGAGKPQGQLAREMTAMFADDPRAARPYTVPMRPDAPGAWGRPGDRSGSSVPPGRDRAGGQYPPGAAAHRARSDNPGGQQGLSRDLEPAQDGPGTGGFTMPLPPSMPGAGSGSDAGVPPAPPAVSGGQALARPAPGGWQQDAGYRDPGWQVPGVAGNGAQPGRVPAGWEPVQDSAGPSSPPGGGTGPVPAWLGGGTEAPPRKPQETETDRLFPDPEPEWPCPAGAMLLAALAVPPAEEVPGVRMVLRPQFDVTPETRPGDRRGDSDGDGRPGGIRLGRVLNGNRVPAGYLDVARSSLNRHVFVCGATGSGKSQTVRHLLESAAAGKIPWLVIEPAKAEYKLMAARLPGTEVIRIRPGDLSAVPAGINPLEPAMGPDGARFPLQAHADLVRALFLAAFRADEPFPQVLSAALTRVYTEAGWDLMTGQRTDGGPVKGAGYPGLRELQAAALAVVDSIGYSKEITDNVRGFVNVRIGSLLGGTTGGFLAGAFPLDYGRLLQSNVVLEIEDAGDDSDKAFITGAALIRLSSYLRMRARAEGPGSPGLRHLTVIEEAHRLLRQPAQGEGGGPAAHAVEMFADLLAEIRAYGEGLVIAEQIPSKLIPDAIKNTAVKIVHRLPARDDRDAVGATMNMTEDMSRFLVTLQPGEAAVFTDGMDYPVLTRMPDGTARETAGGARGPVTAQALVGTRSRVCPDSCAAQPCRLGQIAAGRQARARDRRITLWAEMAVVAHLTGWRTPVPSHLFADALRDMDARVLECALAHATEEAVSARSAALVPRVDPAALAAHVSGALRNILAGKGACQPEQEWLAPAAEWEVAADLLRSAIDTGQTGRHPLSSRWEKALGRRIPGGTCAEQLAVVTARRQAAWGQEARRVPVIFGAGRPSAVEEAYGGRRDAPDWRWQVEQLTEAALDSGVLTWIPDLLAPLPGTEPGRGGTGAAAIAGPAGIEAAGQDEGTAAR
jgi:DNA helicase HerA-like ATPase